MIINQWYVNTVIPKLLKFGEHNMRDCWVSIWPLQMVYASFSKIFHFLSDKKNLQ